MDVGTGPGAELLSPGEAEWPPELRLPPPPPPLEPAPPSTPQLRGEASPSAPLLPPAPLAGSGARPPPWLQSVAAAVSTSKEPSSPPRHTEGFDDSHFLGSIMGPAAAAHQQQQQSAAVEQQPVVVKRKRGRPPKNRDGAAAAAPAALKPVKKREDNEEVVCFICFDGGNLVVCDRRGCTKVYHPACIKRDESFFRSRGKWNCGWHICSSCEKAVHYMCYTCTYSLCKGCIKQGKFFGVRGNKGFCDTCYGTILLIESKDEDRAKVNVDFDDKNSWEYLFKLYWLDLKGKHSLTLQELVNAKSCWTVRSTSASRREKEESSDDLYDANDDLDASSDGYSRKRKWNSSSGKRGRKRQTNGAITTREREISIKGAESLPKRVPNEGMTFLGDTQWASSELLEFIGHMRNGDISYISQFDVQVLLLEYIKQNNLRDPRRKSQIICDARLNSLFRKPRVGHFEMLKLLEMHFHAKEMVNSDSQKAIDPDSAQVDSGGHSDMPSKLCSDKRRKIHKKIERESPANLEDYAAIDMHNINLIYLRRSLLEDLIDDNGTFSEKITGAFVRIRTGVGQKQDMYRLVKVLGTHKVAERYSVGKKATEHALEILNLDKKEVITMDTISNQDFMEEECTRLRQSMKCGLITRLKVGDIHEKAKIFQAMRVNDWLENEKQRLSHLRDRASETGRRKELRECVEKLQLLSTPEERARRINEDPEVHVDPRMAPNYESAEELDVKKTVDWTNRNGSDLLFPGRKGTETKTLQNHTQNCFAANRHTTISPPTEGVMHRQGEEGDMEPEKVWHYKDPSGNVQGPFTLLQLSKWAAYFPRDLRIWLTFESEQNSLLLTEVLSKQKDFIQPSSKVDNNKSTWEGIGQDRVNSSLTGNNSPSPIGYNVVYSSRLPSPSADCSASAREGPNLLGGTLPFMTSWKAQKDAQMLHGQAQHQGNYSCTIPSSAVSYRPSGSHDEWPPRGNNGEWNNSQDSGGMWSPTTPHTSRSNLEHRPDRCITKKQLQNDSESNSLAGFAENLNSQMDFGSQKVHIPAPQQSERDLASSVGTSRQSEFKTCPQEGSCWSSTADPITCDGLQLSIASAKPESCSAVNPIEDGDSSSASRVPNQSGAPVYSPQSAPATSNLSKSEVNMNQCKSCEPEASNKSCEPDASNAPVNQPPKTESNPVLSPDTQDFEHTHPSPTPEYDTKEPLKDQSGSTSVATEESPTRAHGQSSIAFISETSSPPSGKIVGLQPPKDTSFLVERDLKDGGSITQTEQPKEESTTFKRENIAVNPISDTEAIVSGVLESLTESYNLHEETPLENFTPASAEEEQPQCSSPIALSPWGEPSYYQGEAVDSALWGVQDDQSNDMWSLSSPTPTLQPSGLGADVKDASCVIEEVIVAQRNNAVAELSPALEEKKIEKAPSASIDFGVREQVKPKPSAASYPEESTKPSGLQPSSTSLQGSTKSSGLPLSGTSLEGGAEPSGASLEWSTKVSGVQSSGSSLEGSKKAFVRQQSGSSLEGNTKASSRQQPGSSLEGSKKPSDRQQSGASQEENTKQAWQPPVPSLEGGTKPSGWKPSISIDGNTKASGWRSSSSPDGSRKASVWQSSGSSPVAGSTKASGWQSSPRESSKSKPNSTWGASQSRNSSSTHQSTTPTAKYSSETPRRQGNTNTYTAGWGEGLGNNKSWHSSSGNAGSRGSHSSHHHDRHSQGGEPWRGSSNHSRRSDHRQDHGSGGSSRSSSRGQSQRGICRFYENGYCRKGSSCQYLHR
ncbi:hypothetical protein E2562_010666 [Oryza meyeriana var. granulata]|uniref:Zinc finger CCCH domain-containing protein 44 n=1 Tax=Oryza meyeriana var. granulata TaxID=110450 RepID=A0A6G1EVW9_9ORYZ|nr:hypothetical protein E2562_010666 [Oryza meyeriana var. granulata]